MADVLFNRRAEVELTEHHPVLQHHLLADPGRVTKSLSRGSAVVRGRDRLRLSDLSERNCRSTIAEERFARRTLMDETRSGLVEGVAGKITVIGYNSPG